MNATRKYSLLSGVSLLIMTLLAIFAFGVVLNSIYVEDSVTATAANIQAHSLQYAFGNISWVLILILDVLIAIGFYQVLKQHHRTYALLSGTFRLLYSAIFAIGIAYLFFKDIPVFMRFWSIGLFVIGFHLIFTGLGSFYAKVPKLVSLLLLIAGISYSLIHGIYLFAPGYEALGHSIESIMSVPMTIGELSFGVWLLFRGGRHKQQGQARKIA